MLLTRFVPFASLSYAQTAPSPAGTALQVKLMLVGCRWRGTKEEKYHIQKDFTKGYKNENERYQRNI
jgi:hypothetical protein